MIRRYFLLIVVVLACSPAAPVARRVEVAAAAPPMKAGACEALILTLRPGLNPAPPNNGHIQVAGNAPRGGAIIRLPLYPGGATLTSFVASALPSYPVDPYLQTAGSEFATSDSVTRVKSWVRRIFPACGWRERGSWTGNASAFTSGIVWQSVGNPDVSVEISFGSKPSGGTYIGYGVEAIILPPRPGQSYLHGPFSQVRIALKQSSMVQGQRVSHVVHVTVRDTRAIRRLVSAINAIKGYRTVSGPCAGGLSLAGPAWLSFVRPDGTIVHAFEVGPGICGGGLAVNGVRWLTDSGAVWKQILSFAAG